MFSTQSLRSRRLAALVAGVAASAAVGLAAAGPAAADPSPTRLDLRPCTPIHPCIEVDRWLVDDCIMCGLTLDEGTLTTQPVDRFQLGSVAQQVHVQRP
jgi:hypothetical protein